MENNDNSFVTLPNDLPTAERAVDASFTFKREKIALDCLKAMLLNPNIMSQSFEVIADFSFRQADAFLAKAREPQI